MERNSTMIDVAREAGVGLKTVSRYVNGETNIAPALGERIGEAIRRLGYRKNLAAASIRPGHTSKVLGLVIGDIGNPYYSVLTRAIEREARESNYLLITASSEEDGARHDELVDRLLQQRVEGLIIVPPKDPGRSWAQYAPPLPPVVFVDRPDHAENADVVLADDSRGAREATATLIRTAGMRVAFVGDSLDIYTMEQRHHGYVMAIEEAGGKSQPSLVYSTAHDSDDAAHLVLKLLTDEPAIDAIFAANNRSSMGAVMAFNEAGRRLPLIGFDDFEAAVVTAPQVSVVTHDIAQMGCTAARFLIDRIQGKREGGTRVVLPTQLLLRGSEQA